jgi:hypothetical protein
MACHEERDQCDNNKQCNNATDNATDESSIVVWCWCRGGGSMIVVVFVEMKADDALDGDVVDLLSMHVVSCEAGRSGRR